MKQKIINFLSSVPFVNNYFTGVATIFMLHRVYQTECDKLFPNENMKISPEFLDRFIVDCKDKGYEFISLNELYDILQNQEKVERKIVLTMDDGYKDNFTLAYPIFKKHKTPFAVYITTSFPNKKALLWWYALEDLIVKSDKLIVRDKKFICKTYKDKSKVFLEIRDIILKLNQKNLLSELNELFKDYDIDWFDKNDELCMSWDDIILMSKDVLCTIGGHTANHYVFNKLNKKEVLSEVMEANKEIEKNIGKKIHHFCYPFGGRKEVTKKEMDVIKNLNFKTVTTARNGNIYLKHKDFSKYCLPRIMLTENFDVKNIGRIRKRQVVTV